MKGNEERIIAIFMEKCHFMDSIDFESRQEEMKNPKLVTRVQF